MRWTGSRSSFAAALVAGAVLRGFFVLHHPLFLGDTLVYGDLAHNMLAHHIYGLTEDHVRSTLIRLPGYPLFLVMCFAVFGTAHYMPVLWVQVAVDLLGCVLLGRLAARSFGPRVGLAAVWVSALCPFTANYAAAGLAETLSIFCVTVALWAMAAWVAARRVGQSAVVWALVLGGALAGAALLRPDGGLLAAAVVPAMLWVAYRDGRGVFRRGVRDAGLASALLCLTLGLWAVRNWRVFHVIQPLAPKYANDPDEPAPVGFARWYRTWAIGFEDTVDVYWAYDGSLLDVGELPARAFDSPAQRRETVELYARYNDLSSATPEIDAAFGQLAAERVAAHPVRYYVLLPAAKLADMWLRPRTELMKMPVDWWRVQRHLRKSVFEMTYAGLNAGLLGLAVVGLVRWQRVRWTGYGGVALAGVLFVLLRSAMLMTIDNSEPRYTLECYPVVLLLAAVAVVRGTPVGSSAESLEVTRAEASER